MLLNTSKTTWDLTPLYKGDDDPQMLEDRKEIERVSYAFITKWRNDNSYTTDLDKLKEALDEYEAWVANWASSGKESYYFWLRSCQDENDTEIKAKVNKIEDFAKKISSDITFFELNLAKIQPELQTKILADLRFAPYKHFLERIFANAKYLLSEAEEKIMLYKSAPAYSRWVDMVSGFLAKEEAEVVDGQGGKKAASFSEVTSLTEDLNKEVRQSAVAAMNSILARNVLAAEAEINAILDNKKVDDQLRGMERADLSRHLHDDIDSATVDTLVAAVASRFDLSQRYYALKAKLVGLPKLPYGERNVPYGSFDAEYSYQQGADLVYDVLNGVDAKFGEIAKMFIEQGHVDVFPHKGKTSGAFCSYNLIHQPVYVLLNYTNRLRDVTTIAHEFGHGINDELIRTKQNALSFGTPMSTAEVASTFMEDFVLERLQQGLDQEQQLSLMMQRLSDIVSTIFRQIACYRFEQELHQQYREKGYLSQREIGEMFIRHMQSYMGDAVSYDPGSENWWVYWSHIRNYFYVYSYASGLLISKAMQSKVRADKGFVENVKTFLSAGLSAAPADLFMEMGINIRDEQFWKEGLQEIEKLLEETEKLAKQLNKI